MIEFFLFASVGLYIVFLISMGGLYIHIPFCKSRCIYCDFYSTTGGEELRRRYVDALCSELSARHDEMGENSLRTLYLGGGTPSVLQDRELERIFDEMGLFYSLDPEAEVTMEANPDDVTDDFIRTLRRLGVNRVSLGIQTFDDGMLRFLRRRHSAAEAKRAVEMLYEGGIENLSIDLIYGLPGQTPGLWAADLREALSLPVAHLSAYALMYEEGTALYRLRGAGHISEVGEEDSLAMFRLLMRETRKAGFEHYEISNFARPGYRSRHNSAYWDGTPYIGCGPGAHSYDGRNVRRSNDADIAGYVASPGRPPCHIEHLSRAECCDELVFTALRTRNGLSLKRLESDFGREAVQTVLALARPHIAKGLLERDNERLALTEEGIFLSDMVMSDLMIG